MVYCQLWKMRFQLGGIELAWGQHTEMLSQARQPWYVPTSDLVQITEGGVEEKEKEEHTVAPSSGRLSFTRGYKVGPCQPDTPWQKQ